VELYIFNPENDLALANGDPNYVPPFSVRKMAEDLSLLPYWYANLNSWIVSADKTPLKNAILTGLETISLTDILTQTTQEKLHIKPWGWNASLAKKLSALNLPNLKIPSWEQIGKIRELSHRSTSVSLLKELTSSNRHQYIGKVNELYAETEIEKFLHENRKVVIKAPWSGSGKGILFCNQTISHSEHQWCKNILKTQGSIIVEPFYNKITDFAMLFYADDAGVISFSGYSLFFTNKKGAYTGNLLASNKQIKYILSQYINPEELHSLQEILIRKLSLLLYDSYTGYLGIDMMICKTTQDPASYSIHPCVEINLRMTMGMVARRIHDNYISPESTGHFFIDHYQHPDKLKDKHLLNKKNYPLQFINNQIKSGYLALTPVKEDTNYIAYVIISN